MKLNRVLVMMLCLVATTSFSQIKSLMTTPDQKNAQEAQEAAKKAQEALFANRPESPGPDVENFKENLPVKKESFDAKIVRFKKEGFKVAVKLYSGDIITKAPAPAGSGPSSSSGMKQISLSGSVPSIEADLQALVEAYTAKMNESFGTDIFEIVDMSTIPFKEAKWGKVDDWEVTNYRMVVNLSITPVYDYSSFSGKYSASLGVNLSAPIVEYVHEKKGVKMRYPVRAGALGNFKTEIYNSDSSLGVDSTEDLQAIIKAPMGAELVTKLREVYDSKIEDYIAKIKK